MIKFITNSKVFSKSKKIYGEILSYNSKSKKYYIRFEKDGIIHYDEELARNLVDAFKVWKNLVNDKYLIME